MLCGFLLGKSVRKWYGEEEGKVLKEQRPFNALGNRSDVLTRLTTDL